MIQLAVSLGGVQSLIEIAGSMTHPEKYISASERKEGGLSESLVRFRYALIVVLVALLVRPCIEMTYVEVMMCYAHSTLSLVLVRSYTEYPKLCYVHICSILNHESLWGVCKSSKVLLMKCFLTAIIAIAYKCEYNPKYNC